MNHVILSDPENPVGAMSWARTHCRSYVRFEVTDVSDLSIRTDILYTYYFTDAADANWFKLRWQ